MTPEQARRLAERLVERWEKSWGLENGRLLNVLPVSPKGVTLRREALIVMIEEALVDATLPTKSRA